MSVEVLGADFTQALVKDVSEGDNSYQHENVNTQLNKGLGVDEPIKFGSHGMDGPVKGEGDPVPDVNFPNDAIDEWPAPKQIHSFYFVRFRSYEDPKLKSKLDQADKEVQKKNQARFQILESLKGKRWDRAQVISQLRPLTLEDKRYRGIMGEKRKEMEPLQQALGKLRSTNTTSREKGVVVCSSEEELNDLINSLHYRMQHESNTLVEERQLLREIKQLEGTREKVAANAAMKAKIQDSLGQKDVIQDQVKLIGVDLDRVRKEQQAVWAKIKRLEDELKAIDNDISSLQEELTAMNQKRDKAYEGLLELRKQRDEGNANYYQNRSLLNNARELATRKDITSLEELSHVEVEKFISLWSNNKVFRDDYEKRILPSLDARQLSRDGRIRNPDEKPLVSEAPTPTEPETVAKVNIKRPKEDSKPAPQPDTVLVQKVPKEEKNKPKELENTAKAVDLEEEESKTGSEISQKEPSTNNIIDAEKLKEMKREEEISKAKMALERKKKLADKAASKAAIRAQKEAEKKLKEREKKAKKKAAASSASTPEEDTEADTEVVEPEKPEVSVETLVPTKNKERKENTIRPRNRTRGQDPLSKVILKRKKSNPYWVWAAPTALGVLLLLVLGYYYLF